MTRAPVIALVPSTRRCRVTKAPTSLPYRYSTHNDSTDAFEQQRCRLQGLLLEESAAAGSIPTQAQNSASAVVASSR